MMRAASDTEGTGNCRQPSMSLNTFGAPGSTPNRASNFPRRWLPVSCSSVWAWETASLRAALSHGFGRYWWATPMERMMQLGSVGPDSTSRTVCGWRFLTSLSSCHPSIAGMRMSEMITSAGVLARLCRAAAPLNANSMLHSLCMSCMERRMPCRTLISSSTKRMRIMVSAHVLILRAPSPSPTAHFDAKCRSRQTRKPPMKAKSLLPSRAFLGSRLSLRALPPPMTT